MVSHCGGTRLLTTCGAAFISMALTACSPGDDDYADNASADQEAVASDVQSGIQSANTSAPPPAASLNGAQQTKASNPSSKARTSPSPPDRKVALPTSTDVSTLEQFNNSRDGQLKLLETYVTKAAAMRRQAAEAHIKDSILDGHLKKLEAKIAELRIALRDIKPAKGLKCINQLVENAKLEELVFAAEARLQQVMPRPSRAPRGG